MAKRKQNSNVEDRKVQRKLQDREINKNFNNLIFIAENVRQISPN